jgi:hypothetical protein
VHLSANTRFIIQSWKSQVSDAENPSYKENQAKPEDSKQTQLRKTHDSATETWPKLDVNAQQTALVFFNKKTLFHASVVYLPLHEDSMRYITLEHGHRNTRNHQRPNAFALTYT